MDAPPVQYVTTSDGWSIAYAVSGHGKPLVFMPGSFDHVQLAWQYPPLGPLLEALSQRFQLVQFDPRGSGMSGRGLPEDFDAVDYQNDIDAVVDRLELGRVVFFSGGAPNLRAVRYAANHPERVAAMVLFAASFSVAEWRAPALWDDIVDQDWDLFLHSVVPRDRTPEEARLAVEMLKQSYERTDFLRRMRAAGGRGVEDLMSSLECPVLVMHARDYRLLSPESGMKFASLCNGEFVLVEGNTVFGEVEPAMRAVDRFLERVLSPEALPTSGTGQSVLSARELEVLRLIARGRSNAQIAGELVISPNTVGRHVSNIFDKIDAANRAEATAYALRNGLA